MNPYTPNSDDSVQPDDHGEVAEQVPAALVIATATAVISLLVWTGAIIYYIERTYRPDMGFWAVIFVGISFLSAVPVAGITFFVARLAIIHNVRRYRLATILFVVSVLLSPAIIAGLHSDSLSPAFVFLTLAAMLWTPPCLLGFAASGVAISLEKPDVSQTN